MPCQDYCPQNNHIKRIEERLTLQQIYRSESSNPDHSHKPYSLSPGMKYQNLDLQYEKVVLDAMQELQITAIKLLFHCQELHLEN